LKHAPATPSLVSTPPFGSLSARPLRGLVSTAPLAPCQHAALGSARRLVSLPVQREAEMLRSEGLLKARCVLKAREAGVLTSGSRRAERAEKRSPKRA
jgi:hypothetical protein